MTLEELIVGFLNAEGYTVFGEEPERPPQTYVIVGRVGGGMEDHISRAMITVRSYAPTLLQAAGLNKSVKMDMLYRLSERDEIVKVSLNSDYNNSDPETKRYRYQAVYEIKYYEE